MPLQPSTKINLRRNKFVMYRNAAGKSQVAKVVAVTGATLTLDLIHEMRTITTVAVATNSEGSGWHYRTL